MEWSEFAVRLGRELAGLEHDTILIVRERDEDRHYVQAVREPERLYAEAVSNHFLSDPLLLKPADEEVMAEAGWRPPGDPSPRNWWTDLPPFATAADHARLADMMVTALRDVQGVRRPADLLHEALRRHGNGLIELTDLGIPVADPSRVTERRAAPTPPGPEPHQPNGTRLSRDRADAPEPHQPNGTPLSREPSAVPEPYLAAPTGPPPGSPVPAPVPPAPAEDGLEARLADAKRRGDHTTYFDLLAGAELALPPGGDRALPTTVIGGGTYVVVFTSPLSLVRALGAQAAPPRRTSIGELAAAWPDPSWSLAVNPGLPSEVHLDSVTVARLDAQLRTAAQAATVDAVVTTPEPVPPPEPSRPAVPPLQVPPGTRLWRYGQELPVAVYDPVTGTWTPVQPDGRRASPGGPPDPSSDRQAD
ncbi:SseB family protein [Actinomadura craniellae]|uniref:SseB family protein n=1 Tax=Actinomadura craniellae TaxID=2231787 RepID=A0A365GVK4_9ACTN|nr:SseB family protein [Actinomadura craniellae]